MSGPESGTANGPAGPQETETGVSQAERLLFCETPSRLLATVRPESRAAFEACFDPSTLFLVGTVQNERRLLLRSGGVMRLSVGLEEVGRAWKGYQW